MSELLWYGILAGLLSLVGGFLLLWRAGLVMKLITSLIAFGAGTFLAVSFLDLIPEAVETVEEPQFVFVAVLVGFSLFFALERVLMKYFLGFAHAGTEKLSHNDHTESLPLLVILGDSFHNFLDGIVIALAYIANPALGLTTTLAVVSHEVPQEIADFSILMDRGWPKKKIIIINILSSLLTLVGVILGYFAASSFEISLPYLLGGVAGIFIYIAASDLIPEIHHRAGHKHLYRILLPFLTGLILIGYLITITNR